MNWKTKVKIQRALDRVPGGVWLYGLGQRLCGSYRHFSIGPKVQQGTRLLRGMRECGVNLAGVRAVEIGTGWVPIVPMLFWLYGMSLCHTFDVSRFFTPTLLRRAVAQFSARVSRPTNSSEAALSELQPERLETMRQLGRDHADAEAVLKACGIHYTAPSRLPDLSLAAGSLDLVFSNTVLQHVPVDQLRTTFREAWRLLRPGGHMAHLIDLTDHLALGDGSISKVNFLQFSPEEFARFNTRFCSQNRLRAPAYRRLIEEAGFSIVHWEGRLDAATLVRLHEVPVHPDFGDCAPEELCTLSVLVVARKEG